MRLYLHGGFAEKGRTCIGVESEGYRVLLDAGVKTSVRGRDYYPSIDETELRSTDAIVITHAHEDHVAALGWCIAGGFAGRIFATPESQREMEGCLAAYATAEQRTLVRRANIEPLPLGAGALQLGALKISTGRSGHVVGGLWCLLDDGRKRFLYCGDVVPHSPILVMDPLPQCDAIAIDASYADDAVTASSRAEEIANWIAARPSGCVLPTPLFGRSLDLLALVPGPVMLAPGMRDALRAQIDHGGWLAEGAARALATRLATAGEWREGQALPHSALICHDGMGMAGPSQSILALARSTAHPALFTGHLPTGSPGELMVAEGRGDWIRLPTHPTRDENVALVAASGAATVMGHSCDRESLLRLARPIPALRSGLATGDSLDL